MMVELNFILLNLIVTALALDDYESGDAVKKTKKYSSKEHSASPENPCTPGNVYKKSCNVCKCNEKHNLLCTKIACADDLKILYPKGYFFNKTKLDMGKSVKRPKHSWHVPSSKCAPGKIYKKQQRVCFCNHEGKMFCASDFVDEKIARAQLRSPQKVYPKITDQEFTELPTLVHTASECKPGRVYRVDCDICLCKEDGDLTCTDFLCLPQSGINRKQAARFSGQACDAQKQVHNDCVSCNCTDNVLQCKPIDGCKPNLRQKGGHFPHSDTFLDITAEKCTPFETLTDKCNVCHCQPYGGLRCTQKICLSFRESQQLRAQLEYLRSNDV